MTARRLTEEDRRAEAGSCARPNLGCAIMPLRLPITRRTLTKRNACDVARE